MAPAPQTVPALIARAERRGGRILEPIDRISEALFGLIMVLTFTGSLSVADAGRDDVRTMLIGALGCNLAWGIIDAILYLMGCVTTRSNELRALHGVRSAADPEDGRRLLVEAMPPMIASVMEPSELDVVRERLQRLPEPPPHGRLAREDWLGGLGVFVWVFAATLPVAIPFVVMQSVQPAMRVSNGVAVLMLFLTGFAFGRAAGRNPWLSGLGMLVVGLVLVAMTIALGG